jgi:hypothetical protein
MEKERCERNREVWNEATEYPLIVEKNNKKPVHNKTTIKER